jgi:tol-pal system protein YbgF
MQGTKALLISLGMLTCFGCASQGDLESVRRDNDEMKSRIFAMEKNINEVRGEVKEGVEKSLAGYRQNVEQMQKDMTAMRKGGADLQATLDSARVDMQLLTGKVDDVRVLAEKPAQDIAMLKDDLTKRLASVEERLTKLEKNLADQQAKAAQLAENPENMYQQGYDAMQAGDVAKARETFNKFLERYPKHKLAPTVHFWLAEGYYSEKNYDQAILEYQEVIRNSADKEKVPTAMLKQGLAFKESGDPKSASYVWKKLIEEYPKSDEAKQAKEKMPRTK